MLIKAKEQELSSLNDVIAPLLAKRDRLNDDILLHKALLTPARRLFPELISEVFTHSISHHPRPQGKLAQKYDSPRRFAMPSVNETPLVLGRICRSWRRIALSTPSLWSTINIPKRFSIEGLREWISRAGSCKISFILLVRDDSAELSKLLASYQNRWSDVVLRFSYRHGFPEEFVKSLSPEYHSLQTLEIRTWISDDIPLVIRCAPNLRGLIVRDPTFKIITMDDSPSLSLRKIDVRGLPMFSTEFLQLLHLSPAVQAIGANLINTFDHDDHHRDILTLPALKQMNITDYEQQSQDICVLERLYAPALEEFSFHTPVPPRSVDLYAPQIISLLQRSCPPLKVLHVSGGYPLPSAEILGCLPSLPLLSTLHLEQLVGELDGLIHALTGPIPPSNDHLPGCICPELNEIYFKPTYGVCTASELVINMILSRSPSGMGSLAHVTVLSCQESEVLTDRRIADCIESGLKFVGGKLNR